MPRKNCVNKNTANDEAIPGNINAIKRIVQFQIGEQQDIPARKVASKGTIKPINTRT